MIMKIAAGGVVALALLGAAPIAMAESQSPGTSQGTTAPSRQSMSSATDQSFIKTAIEGNLAEIAMGKLAQEKGKDDDVKELGRDLVEDHTKANEKAMKLAQTAGITAPTEPNAEQKKAHEELSKLSGDAFDRQFAQVMIKEHKQAIQAYTAAAEGDGPVADYADEVLPDLRDHLEDAEEIAKELASKKRSEK
ncbi:MAG TPA: DUF4142 domain-containing protein [Alphaproteobacteria bacterium]|jgi:putative membrane protein